jgi:hypothetical protein
LLGSRKGLIEILFVCIEIFLDIDAVIKTLDIMARHFTDVVGDVS